MIRILLFLATNAAIMIAVSVIFNVLGLQSTLDAQGVNLNLEALLVMSAVIGMTGSVISLFMSKWSAKNAMGVHVIEQPQNQTEQWLVSIVARQAQQAGIGMPEVGIFDTPEPNAFATGRDPEHAAVAVTAGIMRLLTPEELRGLSLIHISEPTRPY